VRYKIVDILPANLSHPHRGLARQTNTMATPIATEKVPETMMDSKTDANLEEGSIMEKVRTTSETYNATMSLDPVAERKLVWKLDLRLSELATLQDCCFDIILTRASVPVLAIMSVQHTHTSGRCD
jgi:hypothetical protein